MGAQQLSSGCSTQDSNDGSGYHALHWPRPADWTSATFNVPTGPGEHLYECPSGREQQTGLYPTSWNVFDDHQHDASFIWSTNLILDNEVLVRHTVDEDASVADRHTIQPPSALRWPEAGPLRVAAQRRTAAEEIADIRIRDLSGRVVKQQRSYAEHDRPDGLRTWSVRALHRLSRSGRHHHVHPLNMLSKRSVPLLVLAWSTSAAAQGLVRNMLRLPTHQTTSFTTTFGGDADSPSTLLISW